MNAPAFIPPMRRKLGLRVDDFLLLAESGAFAGYEGRIELIDGDIYLMAPLHSRHGRAHSRLLTLLSAKLEEIGADLEPLVAVSSRVADDSLPEPDIVLTRYRGNNVVPADSIALIVEVSDSTFDFDSGRKSELYAAAGVPEYWVVDCEGERILIREQPGADGYTGQREVAFGDRLVSATILGLELETTRLLD